MNFIDFNKSRDHRHIWLINFFGISQHSMTAKDIEMCTLTGEIGGLHDANRLKRTRDRTEDVVADM
jgi:hypothetical protein